MFKPRKSVLLYFWIFLSLNVILFVMSILLLCVWYEMIMHSTLQVSTCNRIDPLLEISIHLKGESISLLLTHLLPFPRILFGGNWLSKASKASRASWPTTRMVIWRSVTRSKDGLEADTLTNITWIINTNNSCFV